MTKENRVKICILSLARDYIEDGDVEYVCFAIEEAADSTPGGWDLGLDLIDDIQAVFTRANLPLGCSVEVWLNQVHGIPQEQLTPKNMRDYRIRWLTRWIQDLENTER